MWTKFGDDWSKTANCIEWQTNKQTNRQTDRQTDKPLNEHTCQISLKFWQVTNRQTYRQTDKPLNEHTCQISLKFWQVINTVLLIKFLPSLPVTAERGSAPRAPYPPERATSGIATCSVVGDTYRPVAKLSPALGWWTLSCLACLACLRARIRARPAKQSTGWRNIVTNV